MKVALILANGFEEVEALAPLDALRRAGVAVDTIGIDGNVIKGAHNISVLADVSSFDENENDYDAVIFPGGMPGSINIDNSPFTDKIIKAVLGKNGRLAAICAAPLVLGKRGLLEGKNATCFPGFEGELKGAKIVKSGVVTDGNITTASGMLVALDFAKELVSLLASNEAAEEIFTLKEIEL